MPFVCWIFCINVKHFQKCNTSIAHGEFSAEYFWCFMLIIPWLAPTVDVNQRPQPVAVLFRGARRLTYSHHAELHVLLHHHDVVVLREDEGAVERAAVRPCVVVGNVMKVNSPGLNVAGGSPTPLQAAEEILVEDVSGGVVIAENLRKYTVETTSTHTSFFVMNTKIEGQAIVLWSNITIVCNNLECIWYLLELFHISIL